jgi:hypothetical protein
VSDEYARDVSRIKTVLVPASGSDTDTVVFETALAAARPVACIHPIVGARGVP